MRVYLLGIGLLIAGCTTVGYTDQGRLVRNLGFRPDGCEFLGMVQYPGGLSIYQDAEIRLKNQAADLGGNVIYCPHGCNQIGNRGEAEAYRCQK